MKTLIIYYHPYEGSYCHSILGAVKTGLKKGGHACKVIDLDIDGFDPVMRGEGSQGIRRGWQRGGHSDYGCGPDRSAL